MGSAANATFTDGGALSRLDDDELGSRIALALRTRRPTLDFDDGDPLLAGKYRLEGRVSADGHVERFDAVRVTDGRWVTIEQLDDDSLADPQNVASFVRSARLQCRLRHPHVMYALEHGETLDGRPYLVREALDTESLATMLAREGSVTWTRVRSIALQLCNAVSAARDLGLAPVDLSIDGCRRARHGRAIDDIRLSEWRELEVLTPDERDERAAVFAIGRIVEELVAGHGPDGAVGTNPQVVPPPPAELGTVLARARSLVPSARYASVQDLGLAIAAIGEGAGARAVSPDDTMYALHVAPRRKSRPIEQSAEITCATAAVLSTPATDVDSPPAPLTAPVEPTTYSRRMRWPWVLAAAIVASIAVDFAAPTFWPAVGERVNDSVDAARSMLRGREALDVPPAPIAAAAIVVPAHADAAEEPELVVATPVPTPAPVVIPPSPSVVVRSSAIPPAPPPSIAPRRSPKPRASKKAKAPIVQPPIVANEVDVTHPESPESPALPASPASPLSMDEQVSPEPTQPPHGDPPTDTPPVQDPPREAPDLDEPPPVELPPPPTEGVAAQ